MSLTIEDLTRLFKEEEERLGAEIAALQEQLAAAQERLKALTLSRDVIQDLSSRTVNGLTATTGQRVQTAKADAEEGKLTSVSVNGFASAAAAAPSADPGPREADGERPAARVPRATPRDNTRRARIMAVMRGAGEPMRARQVAEAIGMLDPNKGQLEGLRGHLGRLVKDGKVAIVGRGLYQWVSG
ncbi:hypothetical protein K7472_07760 [Streptomyces sp. PTM05]|uniref:Uncharacterized protein n=1 Tax=Streptantibioticus parmotrematis TaxID=2873249 RepID=A0ABS7QNL5_9ACTN|nr:hypothetical protein [Streptantibioticus parmotrematis]MBY8884740.1 hypothetical protein [Streptantibioticus parmotrematis]